MKGQTFFPFGPPIFVGQIDDSILSEFQSRLDKYEEQDVPEEKDASGCLAGRVKKQMVIQDDMSQAAIDEILGVAAMYYNGVFKEQDATWTKDHFALDGLWVNFQRAREYNPPHMHNGAFSFVLYTKNTIDYSTVQQNEYDDRAQIEEGQRKLGGSIDLLYGENNFLNWTEYNFFPEPGDILMFPSWLKHTVFAFYQEDAVRVSVAGNINFK